MRDKDIETREARRKLKLSGKPHWKAIGLGLHVGYRKGRRGGVWVVRRYCRSQTYKVESIALADDMEDANGVEVLDFWQAQTLAREMRTPGVRGAGGYTVGQAVADYLAEHLEGRASYYDCGASQRVKPFRGVDVPRTRYLTVAECQRLINTASPDFRVLVQAALQTGARYQELARLRASDFNPDAGTLHIRRSKAVKDRHIVLTEEGQRFFAQLATGKPGSALLLGREWKHSQQRLPMVAACKRAKIDGASFHTLRHTWATLAVMAGAPLMVVAKNLGHVDTRMVERHYGHLAPSFVADAIRVAAPRFGMVEPSNVRSL